MLHPPALLLLATITAQAAFPQPEPESTDEQVRGPDVPALIERARTAVAIQELYEVYPEARAEAHFSHRHRCWIIEFLAGDREVGVATVSADGRTVLEASFRGPPEQEQDEEQGQERERGDQGDRERPPGLSAALRPGLEPATLFWLGLLLALLVLFDFDRPLSLRNIDLLSLFALAPFVTLVFQSARRAYTGVMAVTVYYLIRVLVAAWRPAGRPPGPNLPARPLAALLGLALALHLYVIAHRGVDDCGIWGTFGAQHLLRHGQMPYGQEHFGGGDTYGPLFYALHVPVVCFWPPGYVQEGQFHPVEEGIPAGISYWQVQFTAAKAVAVLADFALLAGLLLLGRRWHSLASGLALAAVYAFLPYTIGTSVGGLNFSSHLVATACTVWALVCLPNPVVSGGLLSVGVGALFYPVFLLPLWASYYRGRQRLWFCAAVGAVGLACLVLVQLGDSNWQVFIANTWGQQEGVAAGKGGLSPFGFWGQHQELAWLKRPVLIGYGLFCLGLFFWPPGKSESALIALSAAVLIGTQLWKTHGGGTYVEWYMPWLMMTLAGHAPERPPGSEIGTPALSEARSSLIE